VTPPTLEQLAAVVPLEWAPYGDAFATPFVISAIRWHLCPDRDTWIAVADMKAGIGASTIMASGHAADPLDALREAVDGWREFVRKSGVTP